jgi:hypothetical protein
VASSTTGCGGLATVYYSGLVIELSLLTFSGGMHIPIRAQLSGVIFAKSMRRKDIKGVAASKNTKTVDGDEADHAEPQTQPEKNEPSAEDIEETINKSRQGVINLIGVDAKRVAVRVSRYK